MTMEEKRIAIKRQKAMDLVFISFKRSFTLEVKLQDRRIEGATKRDVSQK
jgi:hypothetical protein